MLEDYIYIYIYYIYNALYIQNIVKLSTASTKKSDIVYRVVLAIIFLFSENFEEL